MPEVLSVPLVFLVPPALLVGWGYLPGMVLARGRHAALRPWLCPALGLFLIGAAGPLAGALGVPLRSVAWPLVLLSGGGWVLLLRGGGVPGWLRAHWPALAVALGALALAASPLAYQGALTTIGGSIDAISYNVRSEYVQDHPLRVPEVLAGKPWLGWVAAQIGLIRVGDVYFLGLSALVLSRRSFEILSVIAALAHAHAALGTYFFARVGLGSSRRVGVLAASFVALSATLVWPGLDCSSSQAVALAFVPVCLAVATALFRRPSPRLAVALGLLLSGLVAVYPVFFVLVAASVGLLGLASIVRFPRPELRGGRAAALLLAGVVSVVAGPVGTARAVRELGFVAGMLGERGISAVGAGNILVYPPLSELFGLVCHAAVAHGAVVGGTTAVVATVLAVVAAALAARGLLLGGPVRALAPLSLLLTAGGLAVHQRFLVNPPAGYPYGYYKAVTLLAMILAPLLASGLAGAPGARRLQPWALVLAAGFLLFSARHTLWTLRYSATTQVLASKELLEAARAVERFCGGRPAELIVERGPRENWLGYLLRDERVVFPGGNALHPVGLPPLDDAPALALIDRQREAGPDGSGEGGRASRPVWEGRRFRLVEWTDSQLAEWPLPGAGRWTGGVARATVDRAANEVVLEIGGFRTRGPLPPTEVRTIQLGISSPAGAVLSSPTGEVRVAPGAWLVDWDTSCKLPLELVLLGGDAVPGSVFLLNAGTGEPGRCVELLRSSRGFLEWKGSVAGQVLHGEIEIVPPADEAPAAYRVGVHVGGEPPGPSGPWGVFSLDLPADGRPHRAAVRIDLRKRTGLGWVDGAREPVEVVTGGTAGRGLEATLVLSRTRPDPRQLVTARVLNFDILPGGAVGEMSGPPEARRWWSSR